MSACLEHTRHTAAVEEASLGEAEGKVKRLIRERTRTRADLPFSVGASKGNLAKDGSVKRCTSTLKGVLSSGLWTPFVLKICSN